MPKRSDIVWPAAVIALLLMSGVTTFAVLIASRSDGGAQVVGDYYRKSVAWDSLAAERRESEQLGWIAHVEMRPSPEAVGVVSFSDRGGRAITGLVGSVTVSRPQSATTYGTHSLAAVDSLSGSYVFSFPYAGRGLWDLDMVAKRGEEKFVRRIRIEI